MMWFVFVDGRFLGTVIAATQDEADRLARMKFPMWGLFTIVRK